MRFRTGDIVKISKKSQWYGTHDYNPKDIEGTIRRISHLSIYVDWSNNTDAPYYERDLKLVRRGQ